ncbi:MAG TPA: hypothetical protein VK436_00060 [Methanocella sp.]|nr:hypothetical protein [Methanocella sp.]
MPAEIIMEYPATDSMALAQEIAGIWLSLSTAEPTTSAREARHERRGVFIIRADERRICGIKLDEDRYDEIKRLAVRQGHSSETWTGKAN